MQMWTMSQIKNLRLRDHQRNRSRILNQRMKELSKYKKLKRKKMIMKKKFKTRKQ